MNLAFLFLMAESKSMALSGTYIVPDWWGMMIAVYYRDTYRVGMTWQERFMQIRRMEEAWNAT